MLIITFSFQNMDIPGTFKLDLGAGQAMNG